MSAALVLVEPPAPQHNTLASFHAGCRCGFCESASLEQACSCPPCARLRRTPFFTAPRPLPKWWTAQ